MKRMQFIASIVITALLFILGILTLVLPNRSISENENRILTVREDLTDASIMDGTFQDRLETYLSDQFPERDVLMSLGTALKKAEGKNDIEDTYLGKDHYFFEKVLNSDIDQQRYLRNLSVLEKISESYADIPMTAMLIPSSGIVLSDKLPDQAALYDADGMIQTAQETLTHLTLVDPTQELKNVREEYIYYRTDHHWTAQGAYIGYEKLMGKEAAYTGTVGEQVSDDFYGTLYSRTLDSTAVPDSISLPEISEEVLKNLTVTADANEIGLYDLEALSEKDQYQVYFGGNYGRVDLEGCSGEGTLLIIKDSFANTFVPYLTQDYAHIIMIDLRYYPGTVNQLLSGEQVDEVLFLYELNNFATDSNIVKLEMP